MRETPTNVVVRWISGDSTNLGLCSNIAEAQLKVLNHVMSTSASSERPDYTCADIVLLNVDSIVFPDPVARSPPTMNVVLRTGDEITGAPLARDDEYWHQALLAHAHGCPYVATTATSTTATTGDTTSTIDATTTADWRTMLPEHCRRVAQEMIARADDSDEVASCVLLSYCANGGNNPFVVKMLCDGDYDADEDAEDKEEERNHVSLGAPLVGSTPLMYAAYHGHYAICEALIDANADVDWETDDAELTALDIAARRDHADIVMLLIERGARIEDGNGSALHVAAEYGSMKALAVLLEAKDATGHIRVNINMMDNKGETALHWAVESDQATATLYLGHMKADLNKRNHNGETPLFKACYQGSDKCVGCMLELKAQLNVATKNKLTPLHISAQQGHVSMVETLLLADADPNLLDNEGRTPMQRALLFGGHVVADVFRQFGAEE
eukprot:GEMP01018476.1.p1 GENE.GEMP01018476.1~~GEMP01018476.1.p1  ORF type:complete len:443 (+),score=117.59 GEMP01018476.1:167-1495(+)